jgi:hypothetical protein
MGEAVVRRPSRQPCPISSPREVTRGRRRQTYCRARLGLSSTAPSQSVAPPAGTRAALGHADDIPIVARETGRLLSTLVHAMQANRILEIGTAYGYSTLWMALAMPPAGKIWTIDPDAERTAIALEFLRRAEKADSVNVMNQPALEILPTFPGPQPRHRVHRRDQNRIRGTPRAHRAVAQTLGARDRRQPSYGTGSRPRNRAPTIRHRRARSAISIVRSSTIPNSTRRSSPWATASESERAHRMRSARMLMTDSFRSVMRRFPTGVTVVTTVLEGKTQGLYGQCIFERLRRSADDFDLRQSLRAQPPADLAAPDVSASTSCASTNSRSRNVSRRKTRPIRSRAVSYTFAKTGAPVLEAACSDISIASSPRNTPPATHTIFIGSVLACQSHDGAPLGYFDAHYRDFGCLTV